VDRRIYAGCVWGDKSRLLRSGTPGQAIVVASEWKRFDLRAGRMAHRLTLEVHYADGTTGRVVRSVSSLDVGGTHEVGDVLPVRYDPADHADVEIDVPAVLDRQRRTADAADERRVQEARQTLEPPPAAIADPSPDPSAGPSADPDDERMTAEWLERLVRLKLDHAGGSVSDEHCAAGLDAARAALADGSAIRATGPEAEFVAAVARAVIGDPIEHPNAAEARRAAELLEGGIRLKRQHETGALDDDAYRAAQADFGRRAQQFD
jgi:hypothetical protein